MIITINATVLGSLIECATGTTAGDTPFTPTGFGTRHGYSSFTQRLRRSTVVFAG